MTFSRMLLAAAFIPFSAWAAAPLPPTVELAVGQQIALDVPGLLRMSIGRADIADVKPAEAEQEQDAMQVVVIGVGVGETTLTVWQTHRDAPTEIRVRVTQGPIAIAPTAPDGLIPIGAGKAKILIAEKVLRIAVGDAQICDVKTIGNHRLLLTGGTPGETTLILWLEGGVRKSYLVRVVR